MKKNNTINIIGFLIFISIILFQPLFVSKAQSPIVDVLFFYSPTCPHCHEVREKDMPIFKKLFGEQLHFIEINTYEQAGSELYMKAVEKFNIPESRQGVPTMIIGDTVLVGSYEIDNMLPELVEDGLNQGGIAMPELPGLSEYIRENNGGQEQQITFVDLYKRDLMGNSISVVVLLGLVISFIYNISIYFFNSNRVREKELSNPNLNWLIPIIALVGLGVAIYLSFVEITNIEAVCGPVGDCNTVQRSPYAKLFGVLPIGIIGIAGFVAILILWALSQYSSAQYQRVAKQILWGITLFGVLFASYLTFLEPFVIGATCAWCLTVAVCMMALLFLTTPQAAMATVQAKQEKMKKKHR